jgi:acetoin utilization deacetylase AcuC-like enzyme
MKIIYHEKFLTPYPTAGVENPDRIRVIYDVLEPHFSFLTPEPAAPADLLLVHTPRLLQSMTNQPEVYEISMPGRRGGHTHCPHRPDRRTGFWTTAAARSSCQP